MKGKKNGWLERSEGQLKQQPDQTLHDVQFAASHTVQRAYKYRPITAAVISNSSQLGEKKGVKSMAKSISGLKMNLA